MIVCETIQMRGGIPGEDGQDERGRSAAGILEHLSFGRDQDQKPQGTDSRSDAVLQEIESR
jgi:hypothetical protein